MPQPRSHTTRSRLEEAMRQCACLRAPRKQRSAWACLGCTQRAATLGPRSLQQRRRRVRSRRAISLPACIVAACSRVVHAWWSGAGTLNTASNPSSSAKKAYISICSTLSAECVAAAAPLSPHAPLCRWVPALHQVPCARTGFPRAVPDLGNDLAPTLARTARAPACTCATRALARARPGLWPCNWAAARALAPPPRGRLRAPRLSPSGVGAFPPRASVP